MKIAATPDRLRRQRGRQPRHRAQPAGRGAGRGAELAVLPEYFCLMGQRDRDKLAVRETLRRRPGAALPGAAGARTAMWIVGGTLPLVAEQRRPRAQHQPRVTRPPAVRGALRQDPPVPLRQRPRAVRRVARDRGRQRAAVLHPAPRATGMPGASACRSATTCASPSCTARWRRPAAGAQRLHLRDRPGALGTAAARPRDGEPRLRVRAGAGGRHDNGRRTWGHSMVVDPWGEVLACARGGARAWCSPTWPPRGWRRSARNCPRWTTGCCDGAGPSDPGRHAAALHLAALVRCGCCSACWSSRCW